MSWRWAFTVRCIRRSGVSVDLRGVFPPLRIHQQRTPSVRADETRRAALDHQVKRVRRDADAQRGSERRCVTLAGPGPRVKYQTPSSWTKPTGVTGEPSGLIVVSHGVCRVRGCRYPAPA